jgi:hypothetical protein
MEQFPQPNQDPNKAAAAAAYREKLLKGNLPENPEERNAEIKAGKFTAEELGAANRIKLMTGDKRSAQEIALEMRGQNDQEKAA